MTPFATTTNKSQIPISETHMNTDLQEREWPCWEDWRHGWQMIDGHLHFEAEDIESMLPPHLPADVDERNTFVPKGPWVHPDTESRNWSITWLFENGWSANVYADCGVALNTASLMGINRRVLGDRLPRDEEEWDDLGLVWQNSELGDEYSWPHLDDPDHLVLCLKTIATLPSDPDARRPV